jgi:hypothetical protein
MSDDEPSGDEFECTTTSGLVAQIARYEAGYLLAMYAIVQAPTNGEAEAYRRSCNELDRRIPVPRKAST